MFTAKNFLTGLTAAALLGGASAANAETVSITAQDQTIMNDTVVAERVVAEEDGYLVLYTVKNDGNGFATVDQPVGYTAVNAGVTENVLVTPSPAIPSGDRMVLMLHTDATGDTPGEFEFMSDPSKDGPYLIDGYVTMLVIKAK